MCSDVAIRLCEVGKTFRLYKKPSLRLWEALPGVGRLHTPFEALSGVSFEVRRGEVVGLVGRNGAGKSTLLQVICGTLPASCGSVEVNGRIAALLELGAGFNPEFSGRENVWMNAAILGMSQAEIAARFDDIVAFAEMEAAIDQPVKTYSSGMFVRLAFAVAVHVSPDILVIDEALSVGDGAFAKKSFDRIMALKAQGCTILFCSHSLYQVEAICNRAVWIEGGRCLFVGEAKEATARYQDFLGGLEQRQQAEAAAQRSAHGDYEVLGSELSGFVSETEEGHPVFRSGVDDWCFVLRLRCFAGRPRPSLGVIVYSSAGVEVSSFSSFQDGVRLVEGVNCVEVRVPELPLLQGGYYVEVFVLCDEGVHVFEHLRFLTPFQVRQEDLEIGVVRLARDWSVEAEG